QVRSTACGLHAAAVQLDEVADQRQSDAKPSGRALDAIVRLDEHVEDLGQHARFDADAAVFDAARHRLVFPCGGQGNAATAGRVLGGVVEQVGDDLCEARRVGVERQRFRRGLQCEFVCVRGDATLR